MELTRERAVRRGEADVVEPGDDDKGPGGGAVVGGSRREDGEHDGRNDEEETVGEVAADHPPATADFVDDDDADHLGEQGKHRRDTLVLERVVGIDADLAEDGRAARGLAMSVNSSFERGSVPVVLDGGNTSHLDRSLDSADQQQATERALVGEEFSVRLSGILVLVDDRVADLLVFRLHPGVRLVAVGVELGESTKASIWLAVVDEPSV